MTQTTAKIKNKTYPSLRAAWIPLTALCLAFFVEMVDNTLLSIALPTIARDLGGNTTSLQWVTVAYSLTFGGLLLTAGSIADRFGRRRILSIGLALFGLLSLCVVFVDSIDQLIILRAALGIPAAMMAPITNSLVFRLFSTKRLRMRAMTIMIVVGMSGFILGPLLGGTALAHVEWQWLLVINAPIALLAWIGVKFGVAKDRREDLTNGKLDIPGAVLSMMTIGLACYSATSGVEYGWNSPITWLSVCGAIGALYVFIKREQTAKHPMLDLALFRNGIIRGASIAQIGTATAMAALLFSLIIHFQYAYGWSPVVAGLANLPLILTMLAATPLSEKLIKAYGHRNACLIGAGLLAGSLAGMAWAVSNGYIPIAICMIIFTAGLRVVMTTCAVALVEEMPHNRTSLGTALNDSAQEVGTSIGTALVGTLIAVLVTKVLPNGTWSSELTSSFFHGEQTSFTILAILVGIVAGYGALTLSSSRNIDDH